MTNAGKFFILRGFGTNPKAQFILEGKNDNIVANLASLTDRQNTILSCIVDSYIQTTKPVGSRFLAKRCGLEISAATIRNAMNDLEDLGLISQPHVSAGRIPTDLGYRLYVNRLVSMESVTRRDRRIVEENMRKFAMDVNSILDASSHVLGKISSQLGVVLAPRFYQGVFQKIELVSISENRILSVISIKSGLVKTIMMEMESEVSREQLDDASTLMNERLSGLTLKEVKESIDKRLSDVPNQNEKIIRCIVESSDKLFNFEGQPDLHFGGTHNIVANPEFYGHEYAVKILESIEEKDEIFHFFSDKEIDEVSITIGGENTETLFQNCSIVAKRYHMGKVTGMLGVVGPTRMHYAKIIPLVDYMGKMLTRTLGSAMN